MPWSHYELRGNKVYAKLRSDGSLDADSTGRVEIKYRLSDERSYRASRTNLRAVPGQPVLDDAAAAPSVAAPDQRPSARKATKRNPGASPAAAPADAVHAYTDGACTGNPGPMGIGVVLLADGKRKELSEYLGPRGTNNIAELTAVERALETIADRSRTVIMYTDSSYAIGVLSLGWKAKANTELIARIRALIGKFEDVRFVKVRGHAGVPENERCDELARDAITRRA
jgi:ribonuclease HI